MLHEYEAKLTTKDDVGAEMIKYQAISMPMPRENYTKVGNLHPSLISV